MKVIVQQMGEFVVIGLCFISWALNSPTTIRLGESLNSAKHDQWVRDRKWAMIPILSLEGMQIGPTFRWL